MMGGTLETARDPFLVKYFDFFGSSFLTCFHVLCDDTFCLNNIRPPGYEVSGMDEGFGGGQDDE
jgi:hypothetical protein